MNAMVSPLSMIAAAPAAFEARAIFVRLSVKQWTARKMDKKATRQVIAGAGAVAGSGNFHKQLVSKAALEKIAAIATDARKYHYDKTLPWEANGADILPPASYLEYLSTMRGFEAAFRAAVADFLTVYPAMRDAARHDLGALFNDSDYPHPAVIARKFSFRFIRTPANLATSGDFRAVIGEEHARDLIADFNSDAGAALQSAMRDVYGRIAEHVGKMAERLADYSAAKAAGESAKLFDSMVGNVRDLAALLPGFNLTGDARLAALTARIQEEIAPVDIAALKDDAATRAAVTKAAEEIAADVSAYLA